MCWLGPAAPFPEPSVTTATDIAQSDASQITVTFSSPIVTLGDPELSLVSDGSPLAIGDFENDTGTLVVTAAFPLGDLVTLSIANPGTIVFDNALPLQNDSPYAVTLLPTANIESVTRDGVTSTIRVTWEQNLIDGGTWNANDLTTTGGLPTTNTGDAVSLVEDGDVYVDMQDLIVTTPTAYSLENANLLNFSAARGPAATQTGSVT